MRFHKSIIAAVGVLALAACAGGTPAPRPVAGFTALEAPVCGARIFVAMGFNQNFPQQENMRIPAGDLFLNGELVDAVSKNPEITVVDVPAGRSMLSWVPTHFDPVARGQTQQKPLTLTLADRQTAFVVLDYFDDTPPVSGFFSTAPEVAIRTEVVRSGDEAFAAKRVVFHHSLGRRCAAAPVLAEAAPPQAPPSPAVVAPSPPPPPVAPAMPTPALAVRPPAPAVAMAAPPPKAEPKLEPKPEPPVAAVAPPTPTPQAPPKPQPVAPPPVVQPPPVEPAPQVAALPPPAVQPNASEPPTGFVPAGPYYYYTVSLRAGAPAYEAPRAEGKPLYTFKDATQLNVVAISADRRWLRVLTPERQTVYVSTGAVTMGARGR